MRFPTLFSIMLLACSAAAFAAEPVPAHTAAALSHSAPETIAKPTEALSQQARPFNYSANATSDAFGANLFAGNFAQHGASQFNPDYLLAIGDRVQVRLWGGYTFDNALVIDPHGNLFLPYVGPVKVLGMRNQDLQGALESAVRQVFRSNVYSYASLASAQPVRVFVGGNVNRPGLYNGTSMDSILQFLDQAGGIDADRGSFLNVQVKRGEQVRTVVNLYDFLLDGRVPLIQLSDGDVIFVAPRHNTVRVMGLAENAKRFEFRGDSLSMAELARLAKPRAQATHVRVVRNTGMVKNTDYYALSEAGTVRIADGDEVEFTADKKTGTITVRVEGDHMSPQEYVLPYGARIGPLLRQISPSERSDMRSVQLFRHSVRERQKALLQTSMTSLESTVLTARSGTNDEAQLRKDEANLILQWVERAKKVEPRGQVFIAHANLDDLPLENGDIIRVPTRDGLVLVGGEVLFPNAIAHESRLSLNDYIQRSGGYTQNADNSRVVIVHRDGSFDDGASGVALRAGDEVLVLPKVDVKSRQIWKDLTQIIYQIAVGAGVALSL